jgi:hypothetical protein
VNVFSSVCITTMCAERARLLRLCGRACVAKKGCLTMHRPADPKVVALMLFVGVNVKIWVRFKIDALECQSIIEYNCIFFHFMLSIFTTLKFYLGRVDRRRRTSQCTFVAHSPRSPTALHPNYSHFDVRTYPSMLMSAMTPLLCRTDARAGCVLWRPLSLETYHKTSLRPTVVCDATP